nr:unnamed protein product [Spirometra erinaceieuropaei]
MCTTKCLEDHSKGSDLDGLFDFEANGLRNPTGYHVFVCETRTQISQCKDLNIGFTVLPLMSEPSRGTKRTAEGQFVDTVKTGSTFSGLLNLIRNLQVAALITDFSPLREDTAAVQTVSGLLPSNTSFFQVDAHNIVPAWHASDKLEYAARTIRRKLHEKSQTLLTEFPPVRAHPIRANVKEPDWKSIEASVVGHLDESVKPIKWAQGGSRHGLRELFTFLHQRLSLYATARNDPTKNALSQLSPWFHFGHLSVQRAILEAQRFRRKHKESVDAFIEEAFVRRELSDNFCLYNPHYDSIEGAWSWAQETLRKHASDERKPAYDEEAMEKARTDDQLWNAAQRQLLRDGKIHGFLRMYWAKKILEWHAAGPEAALALGLRLNDRYSIDGSDPNGFVGVMWSICGIHDQGWSERTIFGKIRYMNYAGCKRKFDVSRFVAQYPP